MVLKKRTISSNKKTNRSHHERERGTSSNDTTRNTHGNKKESFIVRNNILFFLTAIVILTLLAIRLLSKSVEEEIVIIDELPNKPKKMKNTLIMKEDSYEVLEVLHHDRNAFTQGLTLYDGYLYEGTGLHGASELRKLDPKNPSNVLQKHSLSSEFFGEGITYYKDRKGNHRMIQLTWREKVVFIYDADSFELIKQVEFETSTGEGWGISFIDNSCEFVVSDGSELLMFWDCETLEELRRIEVKFYQNNEIKNVKFLNELEVVRLGKEQYSILANVWFESAIVQIDPSSGDVERIHLFNSLYPNKTKVDEVFNGISIAEEENHSILYLTGKLWHSMYKVKLNIAN